jgi:hypothetical protein
MNSGNDVKQAEVIPSDSVVARMFVQDLGKQATTTKVKTSAYFPIAAAALGLIRDGCDSCYSVAVIRQLSDTAVDDDCPDQNNLMTMMTNVCGLLYWLGHQT